MLDSLTVAAFLSPTSLTLASATASAPALALIVTGAAGVFSAHLNVLDLPSVY